MSNFQFQTYLQATPLGDESKHNLNTIFNTLTSERKFEILDNWPKYLDLLLQLEKKGKEEREKNIQEALKKIENLISDALERDRQKALQKSKSVEESREDFKRAEEYDTKQKAQEFQKKLSSLQQI